MKNVGKTFDKLDLNDVSHVRCVGVPVDNILTYCPVTFKLKEPPKCKKDLLFRVGEIIPVQTDPRGFKYIVPTHEDHKLKKLHFAQGYKFVVVEDILQ